MIQTSSSRPISHNYDSFQLKFRIFATSKNRGVTD